MENIRKYAVGGRLNVSASVSVLEAVKATSMQNGFWNFRIRNEALAQVTYFTQFAVTFGECKKAETRRTKICQQTLLMKM